MKMIPLLRLWHCITAIAAGSCSFGIFVAERRQTDPISCIAISTVAVALALVAYDRAKLAFGME